MQREYNFWALINTIKSADHRLKAASLMWPKIDREGLKSFIKKVLFRQNLPLQNFQHKIETPSHHQPKSANSPEFICSLFKKPCLTNRLSQTIDKTGSGFFQILV